MSDEPESIRTLARKIRTTDDANEACHISGLMLQLARERRTKSSNQERETGVSNENFLSELMKIMDGWRESKFKVGDRVRTKGYKDPDDPSHDVESLAGTITDRPVEPMYWIELDSERPEGRYKSFYLGQESQLVSIDKDPY